MSASRKGMGMTEQDILVFAGALVVFLVLGAAGVNLYRMLRDRSVRRVRAVMAVAQSTVNPRPGQAYVAFRVYIGFLGWVETAELRFWAEPQAAMNALRRLHWQNMLWGLFASPLIPLMSLASYRRQRARLVAQHYDLPRMERVMSLRA